eukprot:9470866-Pyramimonas_sp.AAC.1
MGWCHSSEYSGNIRGQSSDPWRVLTTHPLDRCESKTPCYNSRLSSGGRFAELVFVWAALMVVVLAQVLVDESACHVEQRGRPQDV